MTPEQIELLLTATQDSLTALADVSAKLDVIAEKLDTLIQLCGAATNILGYILCAVVLAIAVKLAYTLIAKIFFGNV